MSIDSTTKQKEDGSPKQDVFYALYGYSAPTLVYSSSGLLHLYIRLRCFVICILSCLGRASPGELMVVGSNPANFSLKNDCFV